jgi:hypothetical protein
VAAAALAAEAVALYDAQHNVRRLLTEPGQQRGPEIKAHPGVVVDEPDDLALVVYQARPGVRGITLASDTLVPVVVRGGGVLDLDGLEPGVLAGRLVEVPVDADVARGAVTQNIFSQSAGPKATHSYGNSAGNLRSRPPWYFWASELKSRRPSVSPFPRGGCGWSVRLKYT